jgi:phage-related minor tail protein
MASHLKVDLGALGQVAGELGVLRQQFDSAVDIAGSYGSAVGSRDVVDALDHFATNWKRHREKLASSMDAIASMAQQGHDTYQQVDDQLADSLQTDGGSGR